MYQDQFQNSKQLWEAWVVWEQLQLLEDSNQLNSRWDSKISKIKWELWAKWEE
jgi:hypothetical protein